MSSNQKLRIAILGVGRIGSAFAFNLARVGQHDVTVIARPGSSRFQQLEKDGGIVNVQGERAEIHLTDKLDEATPYDLVVVTLLAHQVDAVLPALQQSKAKHLLFMFNIFDPERLRDAVGAERSAFGMPFIQADYDKDGKLITAIGAGGQKSIMSRQEWVDLFTSAGLPSALEPKMLLWLRCHVPFGAAVESVSVAAVRRGKGASWNECMVLGRGAHESLRMIELMGYPIYPAPKAWIKNSPVWLFAFVLWSLSRITAVRNLLATGLSECRALVDVMVATANKANLPVSVSAIQAMKPE